MIETGEVFAGSLPGRALPLVREWLDEHRAVDHRAALVATVSAHFSTRSGVRVPRVA